jgi:hypothetical protein
VSEIEFLDPVPDEVTAPSDLEPADRRFAVPSAQTVIVPLLWFAAAGLAVAAAFGSVYGIRFEQAGVLSHHVLEAWGGYRGGSGLAGAHGTRYGIPLVVSAVALVAAGVAALASLAGPQRRPQLATILGALGFGGCAAVVATIYLDGAAARDTVAAEQRTVPNDDPVNSFREHVTTGSAVWFGIAAAACALLALVAVPVIRRLTAATAAPPAAGPDGASPAALSIEGDVLSRPDGLG